MNVRTQKKYLFVFILLLLSMIIWGCSKNSAPDPKNPITLSICHVYGHHTISPLNKLIEEFNSTVGRQKGVIIKVASVTKSKDIDKNIVASFRKEPGSLPLPDLFTSYPRVLNYLPQEALLDWKQHLTKEEIGSFVPEFLNDGTFDGKLLMLPIARSTEVVYVNQTYFDKFTSATGIGTEAFKDMDSLLAASRSFYKWSGGKDMLQADDLYNLFLINVEAMGGSMVKNGKADFDSPQFQRVFKAVAGTAICGGQSPYPGFFTDRMNTAELAVGIGSSAGILYVRNYVTYPDNTKENISLKFYPYPNFKDSNPTVIQRGVGLFAFKSDDERRNKAATIFALWLADKERNLPFATSAGYIPVTKAANEALDKDVQLVANPGYHEMYTTIGEMRKTYKFSTAPCINPPA